MDPVDLPRPDSFGPIPDRGPDPAAAGPARYISGASTFPLKPLTVNASPSA